MKELDIKYGTIKAMRKDKGYGFIKNDNGSEIFFHASRVLNIDFAEMTVGQPVEYVEEEGQRGIMAVDVMVTK